MRKIKIHFVDFWSNFNKTDNLFVRLLKRDYDVIFDDKNPDILFYSLFGSEHHRFGCKKIFFTGENVRPNFKECDFSFSFDYSDDPRNYRLPLYALFGNPYELTKPRNVEQIMKEKTKFCNFVFSNPSSKPRKNFFLKLSEYKKVDSGGRVMNNIGYLVPDKLKFISQYKFTIAFENEIYPGYTTEKLYEPFTVNSIPIYWGNPLAGNDFNNRAFLHWQNFGSDEALIERIIQIDNDDALWAEILKEPPFEGNIVNDYVDHELLYLRLVSIVESDIEPIALKSRAFSANSIIKKASLLKHDILYKKDFYTLKIKKFNFERLKFAREHIKRMKELEEK